MKVSFGQVFEKPTTPAAQVLYHVRKNPHMGRGELVKLTGLSQPTITRAVSALSQHGLLRERRDLINTARPGRPVIPLELANCPGILIGIAVDTDETLIGFYDLRGRLLREVHVGESAPEHATSDVLEHIIAAIHRVKMDLHMPLRAVSFGVASPFWHELGWVRTRLEFEFSVPARTYSASDAVALAEIQQDASQSGVFVLFAEHVISASWITETGVEGTTDTLSIEDWLDYIIRGPKPRSIVFSGLQFVDQHIRAPIRARLQAELGNDVTLRLTRPEFETLRMIAAALALAPLHTNPLAVVKS